MSGWKEIADFVLKYDYCCGCGVCAGVCPQNVLEMRFNDYGEYKPYLIGNCTDCGLCSKVCPFINGNPNEDGIGKAKFADIPDIKHTPETGYYLESYVGYALDSEIRWNGASGGLTTWLLCTLFENKMLDYVITVAPTGNPEKFFEYRIIDNPEDVKACSKSAYYPVELSNVLRQVSNKKGRYAIVGLPCFIKAIELASLLSPIISQRIIFKFGLTCGHLNSTFLAEYLLRLKNTDQKPIRLISFREKEEKKPAMAHLFKGYTNKPDELCKVYWNEGYSKAFMHEYFMLNSCAYCDDVFAECSDITFMDAWIDPYRHLHEGTNLLLVRSPNIIKIIKKLSKSRVQSINIAEVINSQKSCITKKRNDLAIRFNMRNRKNHCLPTKRIQPSSYGKIFGSQGLYIRIKERWRKTAKKAMLDQKVSGLNGLKIFNSIMQTRAFSAFLLFRLLSIFNALIAKLKSNL